VPHIKTGKARALAVSSARRSSALPDVPTVAEAANLPGYEATTWQGLLFPANTPKAIVDRMQGEVAKVLAVNETATRLRDLGYEPVGSMPQAFAAYIKAELAKWEKVIKAANIKGE
jgi:tripartite-type tricarboxylate transporter receptor subunit TctC